MIESGQHASPDVSNMALVLIQQLVACNENSEFTLKAKWVILPSVNPDGLEYSIYVSPILDEKSISIVFILF